MPDLRIIAALLLNFTDPRLLSLICPRCGQGRFFTEFNANGYCTPCERIRHNTRYRRKCERRWRLKESEFGEMKNKDTWHSTVVGSAEAVAQS